MFLQQKATQVTSADDDEVTVLRRLADFYPYPPTPSSPPCLPTPYVRVNFVSSLDGAVTHNGKSGDLAGPGDKLVFRMLRGLADVVLVGARTAVAEGYRQPSPDDAFTDLRRRAELRPAPALALLSRSLDVPTDYPPLSGADTVILTCRDAPADRRRALQDAGATLVDCGTDTVEMTEVTRYCSERGWLRVLCEGGPSLFGSLIAADLVDDLCLTISPNLAGGDAGRIAHGPTIETLRPMTAATTLVDDDGFVFSRWVRQGADATH